MDRPAHTDPETLAAVVELGLREWSRPEHAVFSLAEAVFSLAEAVFSLAETVRDRGVPLARLHLGFDLQHPLVWAGLVDWDDVSGGRFEVVPCRGGDDRVRALESSPIWPIRTRETECVRVDLRDRTAADAFGVTRGLARAGFTDYVALALDVGAAVPGAVTFATRPPGRISGGRDAGPGDGRLGLPGGGTGPPLACAQRDAGADLHWTRDRAAGAGGRDPAGGRHPAGGGRLVQ